MFLVTDERLWWSLARMSFVVPTYCGVFTLAKRTLNKIYFSDDTQLFSGERYSWFLRKQYVSFKPGEAREVEIPPTFLAFLKGSLVINGKPYIAYPQNFKSVAHYNLMIGNVKIDANEEEAETS